MSSSPDKTPELNLTVSSQIQLDDATPMMRQYLEEKRQYPGVILLYRMGDFYETFFEDAVITARALEITLTGREAGKLGRVPMAGVPVKALDGYLQRLLEKRFKVAICEQMEDPALAKGLVERRVTRVLSSGTISDPRFLNAQEPHFLGALFYLSKPACWGLAFCDVSTGAFFALQVPEDMLLSELERISPKELLVVGQRRKGLVVDEWIPQVGPEIAERWSCTALKPEAFDSARAVDRFGRWFHGTPLDSWGLHDKPAAVAAVGAILSYLEETYLEEARPVFHAIQVLNRSESLQIQAAARRHLELVSTARDNRWEGSLLWVLDKTCTGMGARLLRQWLLSPAINPFEINSRLDAVEALVNHPDLLHTCRSLLSHVYDMERLAMKVQTMTAMPRDLVALSRSCQQLPALRNALAEHTDFYLSHIQQMPEHVSDFCALIDRALLDSPALSLKEGALFKDGYHQELDSARQLLRTHEAWLQDYEQSERERTGIKTLKLGYNGAFGYFLEISKALAKQAPPDYQRRQTLTNAERFTTPELKAHEGQVLDAQASITTLEYDLFVQLREHVRSYGTALKEAAQRIALLDVFQSLATVACENDYQRPQVDDSLELVIQQGRHPVIDKMLPLGSFVKNDCALSAAPRDHRLPQLMIITGPNMAGKSTYMRQVALIVIMAQMGSFVPASYARIGLVDQLFTRIGAVDDLSSGQSTFMVEMTETAQILNCATPRSLVLLDEVGRGTSTYDGVSIAWSVSEYLVNHHGCRTLFATHYHELNTLEQLSPKIQNFRVLVSEQEGHLEFLHTVAPGAAQKSYGLQVAKMAGLPHSVIDKAERLMNRMQEKELTAVDTKRQRMLLEMAKADQLTLFDTQGS